ncbi:hypothetical protein V8C86DRAFT_526653 [Haematococcus lacustris]
MPKARAPSSRPAGFSVSPWQTRSDRSAISPPDVLYETRTVDLVRPLAKRASEDLQTQRPATTRRTCAISPVTGNNQEQTSTERSSTAQRAWPVPERPPTVGRFVGGVRVKGAPVSRQWGEDSEEELLTAAAAAVCRQPTPLPPPQPATPTASAPTSSCPSPAVGKALHLHPASGASSMAAGGEGGSAPSCVSPLKGGGVWGGAGEVVLQEGSAATRALEAALLSAQLCAAAGCVTEQHPTHVSAGMGMPWEQQQGVAGMEEEEEEGEEEGEEQWEEEGEGEDEQPDTQQAALWPSAANMTRWVPRKEGAVSHSLLPHPALPHPLLGDGTAVGGLCRLGVLASGQLSGHFMEPRTGRCLGVMGSRLLHAGRLRCWQLSWRGGGLEPPAHHPHQLRPICVRPGTSCPTRHAIFPPTTSNSGATHH